MGKKKKDVPREQTEVSTPGGTLFDYPRELTPANEDGKDKKRRGDRNRMSKSKAKKKVRE